MAAQEQAAQSLADAEEALVQATASLATARAARDDADRSLSGTAAELYMQGGDLQDLTTLVLAPPGAMSDLVVVIDHNAHRVREDLDAATSAAQDAATQERLLATARNARDAAAQTATDQVAAAKKEAERASAEAATLATQQEALAARLATLQQSAATLVNQREAAARLDTTLLIGVQAAKGGPRAAQAIASAKMACVRLGRRPVPLPGQAVERRVGVELECRQPVVGRLRHPPGAAGLEDAQRRRRLAHQPGDPDRVGDGLHQVGVRLTLRRLEQVAGPLAPLVLTGAPPRPPAAPVSTRWNGGIVATTELLAPDPVTPRAPSSQSEECACASRLTSRPGRTGAEPAPRPAVVVDDPTRRATERAAQVNRLIDDEPRWAGGAWRHVRSSGRAVFGFDPGAAGVRASG